MPEKREAAARISCNTNKNKNGRNGEEYIKKLVVWYQQAREINGCQGNIILIYHVKTEKKKQLPHR